MKPWLLSSQLVNELPLCNRQNFFFLRKINAILNYKTEKPMKNQEEMAGHKKKNKMKLAQIKTSAN